MPSPSPNTARFDDAIRRANQSRFRAMALRRAAETSSDPETCRVLAGEADDLADFVIEGMKDEGHE